MEDIKVKANNESERKEIQGLLSKLGYNLVNNIFCEKGFVVASLHSSGINFDYWADVKEITLQYLRDLVVLKRNDVLDATHTCGLSKVLKLETKDYKIWDATYNVWVDYIGSQTDFRRGLKPIGKEVKIKEYLDIKYELRSVKQTSGDNHIPSDWIEVPEGADIAAKSEGLKEVVFYKENGEYQFDKKWIECGFDNGVIHHNLKFFLDCDKRNKIVWQRNPTTPNTSIQDKLKFIEKWLNGEKIQYILGIESDKIQSEKTQWHNFTEGAMQYIKRSDIKFREAPKYVTINGIEFKSVKSLLKHVKNNFDLEGEE